MAAEQPADRRARHWSRQTCASWVAAVDRMSVGDYVLRTVTTGSPAGAPLKPKTKDSYLRMTRAFFRDLQEWEWIPRRFDPATALGTPRSVKALTGPDPRVIADDIWAKLLWAGLNLEPGDLPSPGGQSYPPELIRAITLTWLFSGQRSDEIARLRLGCIRWQHDGAGIRGDDHRVLARDAVCLLDVPTHKTGSSFTKPVDPLMGEAIEAWQKVRPAQPKLLDRKTAEQTDFLFACRARRVVQALHQQRGHPDALRQGRSPRRRRPGQDHQPPGTVHHRVAALQRQGADDAVRAASLARSCISGNHSALREDHPEHADQGLQGRRLLRAQHPHHRGAHRPRRRRLRAGRGGRAVAALRPRPRLVLLYLLRAVPSPHGLRQVRLLHPEELIHGRSCSKPRPTCSGCSSPSRSPTTRKPPSTTARKHSTSSSNGSPTPRHPTAPRPGRSPAGPSCRYCRSFQVLRPDPGTPGRAA